MSKTEESANFQIGMELKTYEYLLTPGRIMQYLEATQCSHPWCIYDSPFGGPIAPPTICDNDIMEKNEQVHNLVNIHSPNPVLHAKQEYEFVNPIRAWTKIHFSGQISERYSKRSYEYLTFEGVSKSDGKEVLRSRTTFCWLSNNTEENQTRGAESSEAEKNQNSAGNDTNRSSTSCNDSGLTLPTIERLITIDRCQIYSGWPELKTHHTDPAIATQFGWPGILIQGMLGTALISEMCMNYLGTGWVKGGTLSIKYLKPIFAPQRIKARGEVKGLIHEGEFSRKIISVSVDDELGNTVSTGTASGLVTP